MIKYRPQRGGLDEAMRESREFKTVKEMLDILAEESDGFYQAEDLSIGSAMKDSRINWKESRYVCTKRFGDVTYTVPMCIGYCSIEDNLCIFEIYGTTYEEVCAALKQIEKDTEENFDRISPKPYPIGMEEEFEIYRNEVIYHSETQNIDEKDGFCRFYIIGELPELIHGLLHQLNKTTGKAELIINDKEKKPYAAINYGVYVLSLSEVRKETYDMEKTLLINKENTKKYRYVMGGMFTPTDGEEYEINIPSPFLHDTEEEAMKDGGFGYRFAWLSDADGPEILIYERENFEVIEDGDNKHLKTWVEGNVIKTYTFEEFKSAGGYIRMLKPECKGSGFIDCSTDFLPTDKTFRDVFPDMKKQKLYYIDDEAYCIEEVDKNFCEI